MQGAASKGQLREARTCQAGDSPFEQQHGSSAQFWKDDVVDRSRVRVDKKRLVDAPRASSRGAGNQRCSAPPGATSNVAAAEDGRGSVEDGLHPVVASHREPGLLGEKSTRRREIGRAAHRPSAIAAADCECREAMLFPWTP